MMHLQLLCLWNGGLVVFVDIVSFHRGICTLGASFSLQLHLKSTAVLQLISKLYYFVEIGIAQVSNVKCQRSNANIFHQVVVCSVWPLIVHRKTALTLC